jgi:Transposase DDE domain
MWYWFKKKKQLVVLNTFYNVYKLQFHQQGKKNFAKFFDKSVINRIGKRSGFVQRRCKKISAYHFVIGFIISCCNGNRTFSEWALQIGLLSGTTVSKQGLFERVHAACAIFAKQLLEQVLLQQSGKNFVSHLFEGFNKVVLQDSTTLRLPQVLSKLFPGNHSRGEQKAVARIQSIFDIKAMRFINFSLGAFTQNDQSASGSILSLVKKGDLVIRDLGYFSLAVFEKLIKNEVHFLSRLRYGVTLTDQQGKQVLLQDLLKQKKGVDRWVYIGNEKKVWVRLVMIPVPPRQAADKIRKAKQDRDARLNHSQQYYQWLKFNVYITTADKDIWTAREVYRAYSVRWQIEIIFKSWKSGFNLQHILHEGCTNENRVRVSIFLMLLFICLFMQKIYVRYKKVIEKNNGKKISLLKLSLYVSKNIKEIITIPDKLLKEIILLHCCYDKRSDRINMTDLYQYYKN